MQRTISVAAVILVSFGQVLAGADSASPIEIGSRLELFVDDYPHRVHGREFASGFKRRNRRASS